MGRPNAHALFRLISNTLPQAGAASATYKLAMDPAKYGLVVPPGGKVTLQDLMTGAALGSFGPTVTYSAAVSALEVQVLKLTVAK